MDLNWTFLALRNFPVDPPLLAAPLSSPISRLLLPVQDLQVTLLFLHLPKTSPGFPGIPKAGTHVLYPIPESSSNSPSITATSSSSLATLSNLFLPSFLTQRPHSCIHPASKVGLADEMSPHQAEGVQSDTPQFQYFQEDCAFSSPFWKDEGSASQLTFDPQEAERSSHQETKEVPVDQKGLNQCSLSYICEKLEYLQSAENQDSFANLSVQRLYGRRCLFLCPPHALQESAESWMAFHDENSGEEEHDVFSSVGANFQSLTWRNFANVLWEGLEKPFKELQSIHTAGFLNPKLRTLVWQENPMPEDWTCLTQKKGNTILRQK